MTEAASKTQAPTLDLGGGVGAAIRLRGEHTAGRLAVVEHPFAPGGLIEPHTHALEDEWTYVLVGDVWAQVGADVWMLGEGDHVFKPRGVEHAVWNASAEPARVLEVIVPAGFERFFEEVTRVVGADGSFDVDSLTQLAEHYAVEMAFDKAAPIVERYGLDRLLRGSATAGTVGAAPDEKEG